MMVPSNNKLAQPPNANWHDPATDPPPLGKQLAFTDTTKTWVWIGYLSDEYQGLPHLSAGGLVPSDQAAAFWSTLSEQG